MYLPLHFSFTQLAWDPHLLPVLKGALVQSLLSTVLTVGLGALGALGLIDLSLKLSKRGFFLLQFLVILPSFIPPIMVVTLGAKTLGYIPTGLFGVVLFHCLMNLGLMSLLVYKFLDAKASHWIRFARVANVPKSRFLINGLFPELNMQLRFWSFYFFILYFFSFSIPFLVGGSQYGGVEVFIYEKVLFLGQWSEAIQYCLLLFILIFGLSFLLKGSDGYGTLVRSKHDLLKYLNVPLFSIINLAPLFFVGIGLLLSIVGKESLFNFGSWGDEMRGTLVIGLSVGAVVFLLLCLLTFAFVNERYEKWLLAFVHPGWVFVGFAFLLVGGRGSGFDYLKIIFSLALIYLPFVYRLHFHQHLKELKNQVRITQTMSCSWWKVFNQILWPQMIKPISLLSGVAGLWACGDFALTGMLSQTTQTTSLALQMKSLLSNYRMEEAMLLLWPLLLCSAVVFFAFQGIGYVSGRKTLS